MQYRVKPWSASTQQDVSYVRVVRAKKKTHSTGQRHRTRTAPFYDPDDSYVDQRVEHDRWTYRGVREEDDTHKTRGNAEMECQSRVNTRQPPSRKTTAQQKQHTHRNTHACSIRISQGSFREFTQGKHRQQKIISASHLLQLEKRRKKDSEENTHYSSSKKTYPSNNLTNVTRLTNTSTLVARTIIAQIDKPHVDAGPPLLPISRTTRRGSARS